jgi:RimJ/RimL family protein N-acetyltransferase
MIFNTTRLRIRKAQPTEEDAEMFFRLWTDGRVMANVGFPNGLRITREQIMQRLTSEGDSEYNRLLVVERQADNHRLGECKLGAPDKQGVCETDIKLLPEHWGHSYGVEVKRGLLDYLFTHTDCQAVHATPNVNNRPSIRMQEAVSGVCIGEAVYEFPEAMRGYTQPVHHYTYQVTRQAWEALPRQDPHSSLTIRIRQSRVLTPDEREPLEELLRRVFRDDPFSGMSYAEMDWNVLIYLGEVLASNVEIVEHTVTVDGYPVHVGGIGSVATLPEYRGRGLATQAMTAAMNFIKNELKLEYSLLITGDHRRTFYEGMGWQVIEDPVYFDQPSGKIKNDGITMSLSLAGKPWPPGIIDFCGLPW